MSPATALPLAASGRARAAATPESPELLTGTLARGLAVLDVMLAARMPLTLAEIAGLANLEQSTTLRLLRTLEDAQYVVRHAVTKRYSPSPRAIHPFALLHPLEQLRRETAAVVREAASDLQQTVVFMLFVGCERMVVEIAQTPGSLSPYYDTWLHGPLHGSGGGKSLLLGLNAQARRAAVGQEPLRAFTEHTITSWERLDADLAQAAERGYVVARDEQRMGVTAIGAPVRTWAGTPVGCLVMTGLTRNLDAARTQHCGERIRHAASLLLYQAPSLSAAAQFCGH